MKRVCYARQTSVYRWIRVGSGVETTSFPLSHQAWNPVQGNFRRSLCFGWLSSSRSPVILWSHRALRSPLHSLSILVSLIWEKTLSGETKVSDSPPVFPLQGHSNPHWPPSWRFPSGDRRKETLLLCQPPEETFPSWGQQSRKSQHTARLSKRANPQSGLNPFRNNLNFSVIVALRSFALWPTFYFLDCVLILLVPVHLVFIFSWANANASIQKSTCGAATHI